MYHFPKSFEEEQRKERKRARRRRRKEITQKPLNRREQPLHPATFPVIVERTKASPSQSRHRSKKYYSPELTSSQSGYESAEYTESEEFYGMGCLNRETAYSSSRSKLPPPAPKQLVESSSYPKKRSSRKKKKGIKVEEDHTHSLYPSFLDRPPSRNGLNFAMDSPYRNMEPIPTRKSLENMPGFGELPEMKCIKRPKKLPPIDKENRAHTDEYPFVMKRFWIWLLVLRTAVQNMSQFSLPVIFYETYGIKSFF